VAVVLAVAALAVPASAHAGEIVLGGTVPLSGPAAAFQSVGHGAAAYFRYVNARGGVNGNTIRYLLRDDGYDPARTVVETRRLVEEDGVLAIFNSVGTEHNEAIRPYLNERGIPQLFVGTGATSIAGEFRRYPWTIGYLPSFEGEGVIYGRTVARARPDARIAVLYEATGFGSDLLRGLRRGLGARGNQVVEAVGYDVTAPDVSSEVARLAASRADTLMLFATPKAAIQAYIAADKLGWRPQVYISSVSIAPSVMEIARFNTNGRTTNNSVSIFFVKDPTAARFAGDPGVRLYRDVMRRYAKGRDVNDAYHLYGMAVAHTMVDVLRHAGRNPTRRSILTAATHLEERDNPFLLPGIVVRTTPTFRYPLTQAQLVRYRGTAWQAFGDLLSART
jgi:branched-chain amino acid transport system substrate-binding protein